MMPDRAQFCGSPGAPYPLHACALNGSCCAHPWHAQAHKKAVKEANREKRKQKVPKHVKKAHKSKGTKKK